MKNTIIKAMLMEKDTSNAPLDLFPSLILLALSAPLLTSCQTQAQSPRLPSPAALKPISHHQAYQLPQGYIVERTIHQDFDNNGISDSIYLTYSEQAQEAKEFWVTDNGELFLKIDHIPSQNHHYFVNVDDDPAKEVILIRGEEDYSHAKLVKINLQTQSLDTLFYFHPIIYNNARYYWGYAWDIGDLMVNSNQEIYSAYDSIEQDSEIRLTAKQTRLPALMFFPKHGGNTKSFEDKDFGSNSIKIPITTAKYRSIQTLERFSTGKEDSH